MISKLKKIFYIERTFQSYQIVFDFYEDESPISYISFWTTTKRENFFIIYIYDEFLPFLRRTIKKISRLHIDFRSN